MLSSALLALPLSLASLALAKTDLTGCTSTDVSSPAGASLAWYVPGTGELCDFLNCGGGRAPPKTDVPGCPLYTGTATYSPSYLPGYTDHETASASNSGEVVPTLGYTSATDNSILPVITISGCRNPQIFGSAWVSGTSSFQTAGYSCLDSASVNGIETETGAWSETSETSAALGNSAVSTTSTVHTSPVASTNNSSSTNRNGTVASGTPSSSSISAGAAMETARVWLGGAGLLGLGAVVAAL